MRQPCSTSLLPSRCSWDTTWEIIPKSLARLQPASTLSRVSVPASGNISRVNAFFCITAGNGPPAAPLYPPAAPLYPPGPVISTQPGNSYNNGGSLPPAAAAPAPDVPPGTSDGERQTRRLVRYGLMAGAMAVVDWISDCFPI